MYEPKLTILIVILICSVIMMFAWSVSCGGDDDGDDAVSDDFSSNGGDGGGGGGGGSDDDDNSSDDDDDDVADDDDDDTFEPAELAVIYGNTSLNSSLSNFFTAYGISADLIDEDDLPGYDFTGYGAILVTETCTFYDNAQVNAIADSGKKVMGMYTGGAILFGKLGLYSDLGSGSGYTLDKIVAIYLTSGLWDTPFTVSMTSQNVVEVSSAQIAGWGHSSVNAPANVFILAEIWGTTSRAIISIEDNQFLYWGMEFTTSYYTTNGLKVLANAINLIINL